jgi:hypothetical protein
MMELYERLLTKLHTNQVIVTLTFDLLWYHCDPFQSWGQHMWYRNGINRPNSNSISQLFLQLEMDDIDTHVNLVNQN